MIGIRVGLGLGIAFAWFAFSGVASAAPRHSGFTGDLGIGLGLTTHTTYSFDGVGQTSESQYKFGLAPLSFSLGGFLTPDFALLFRAAGTSFSSGSTQYLNAFYGPVAEVWPIERLFFGAGLGLGWFGPNPLLSSSSVPAKTSLAFDLRVGVALIGGRDNDLTLSLEAIPALYDKPVYSGALMIAWKWY